jgi:hydrogenase maturation factor
MCLGVTGVVTGIRDDDGIPMAVVGTAAAGQTPACLLTCPDAGIGDTVLIHSGYVLRILAAGRAKPGFAPAGVP